MVLANQANTSVLIITNAANIHGIAHNLARRLVANGHRVSIQIEGSAAAHAVRAVGAFPAYSSVTRAGEVRSMIAAAKAQVVINLAPQRFNALPTLKVAWDDAILSDSTQAIIDGAKEAGVSYLLHTSYTYVGAGMSDEIEPFLRAAAKAEKRVLNSGIPAAVARLGFVYGNTPDAAAVRDALKLGRGVEAGKNVPVNFIYAADAADALARAVETRPTGVTLNLVDDLTATTAEFMQYFAQAQGLGLSGRPAFLAALMGSDKRLPALMGLPTHADNAQAKAALGWQPRFPNFRVGIDDVLLSWRAEEAVR